MKDQAKCTVFLKKALLLAGVYNIVFGVVILLFPNAFFNLLGIPVPTYPQIWQCLGMVIGVYGLGYMIASTNPFQHWVIVLVGLLGKVFGPIGFLWFYLRGELPLGMAWMILFNDLIWWYPFGMILYRLYERPHLFDQTLTGMFSRDESITLDLFNTSEGITLQNMSERSPTMMVFLRHFGCTFCREAIDDLADQRDQIEVLGARIVLVHMEEEGRAQELLNKMGLSDIPHISDPENILYKKFQLRRGGMFQIFGPKVWWRGILAGVVKGYGVGRESGDLFQMPGVFLLSKGRVIRQYIHKSAADRPDYGQLVTGL